MLRSCSNVQNIINGCRNTIEHYLVDIKVLYYNYYCQHCRCRHYHHVWFHVELTLQEGICSMGNTLDKLLAITANMSELCITKHL